MVCLRDWKPVVADEVISHTHNVWMSRDWFARLFGTVCRSGQIAQSHVRIFSVSLPCPNALWNYALFRSNWCLDSMLFGVHQSLWSRHCHSLYPQKTVCIESVWVHTYSIFVFFLFLPIQHQHLLTSFTVIYIVMNVVPFCHAVLCYHSICYGLMSVCLSVRLSVTSWCSIKMAKYIIMQ